MRFLFVILIWIPLHNNSVDGSLIDNWIHRSDKTPSMCTKVGFNVNPYDPSRKTFVNCAFEKKEFHCESGYEFNPKEQKCVEKVIDWFKNIHCPDNSTDEYYRNPYNCSYFYRCYRQGNHVRLGPMKCLSTMYFDDALQTCILIKDYIALYGKCKTIPLPDGVFNSTEEQPQSFEDHSQQEVNHATVSIPVWLPDEDSSRRHIGQDMI